MNKKNKPIVITFRPIGGIWQDVAGDSGTLAETLERFGIIIDDKCQFARFYDYVNNICIWYRAYTETKTTLTIYDITPR